MRCFLPQDSIIETNEYTVYKNDTFNRVNQDNKINGNGIWITNDTLTCYGGTSTYTLTTNGCTHSTDNQYSGCSIIENVFFGKYENGNKVGEWINYWDNKNKRIVLKYNKEGKLVQVQIFHFYGEIAYSSKTKIANENKIILFTLQKNKIYKKYKTLSLYNLSIYFMQQ